MTRRSSSGSWCSDVRAERERARFRLHLVHHRTALKNRIHATLMTFAHPVSVADLFGVAGRELLAGFGLPEPWTETLRTSLRMVDVLGAEIDACEEDLRRLGTDHPSVPLLLTSVRTSSWDGPCRPPMPGFMRGQVGEIAART